MPRNHWKNRLLAGVLACGIGIFAPGAQTAQAADAWAVAAQALGVFSAYQSSLAEMLTLGNTAAAQIASRRQDIAENGIDRNPNDTAVVNDVMEQLVRRGPYALKENSLPFIWQVNNSDIFNAACYPTNYVSVNKGLVRGLNNDPDELAAVLAHEMTHGVEQHSARNYAKAVAQYYGMTFLNMDTNAMDWGKLNALASYSIAKNVTLPTEYDADEGGFYIMSGAGFNPGGGAAAMARLAYYLTYETQNIYEYQNPNEDKNKENYNDHPDLDLREAKLAGMMTDYGCGHVTVKDRKTVCIDGQPLLDADWTNELYDNTTENAYLIAGALAKAFHDYDSPDAWQFRADGEGGLTCLTDERVYGILQEFLRKTDTGAKLQALVMSAYDGEMSSGARIAMQARETEQGKARAEIRRKAAAADAKFTEKMRDNSDTYSDYGMTREAMFEIDRAFAAQNQKDEASNYAIRARAKAVNGDFAGALEDSDRAISMDGKNAYNFLNRADVKRMQGDREGALADCEAAKQIDGKNVFSYLIAGQIYDEMENHDAALENFRQLYELENEAYTRIPEDYLKDISPKDYKKVVKAREDRQKALEKKIREEQKEKTQKSVDKK